MWGRGEHGKAACRRRRLGSRQRVRRYSRRLWLRGGVRRGEEIPRDTPLQSRPDQQQPGSCVCGSARAGIAEVLLSPPLSGVRVVALEQAVAAPLCTRHLADLGADVIKLERPPDGDFARGWDSV